VLDADRSSDANSDAPSPPWAVDDTQPKDPGTEQRKKSRMDLLAFKGEINAGDAGIRVVGDLNIAALRVVNAANITVSGAATGIPTVQAPNIGGLTKASNLAGSAAQTATVPAPSRGGEQPSIIMVEFLGFGGGDGNPENEEPPGRKNKQSYDTNSVFQVVGNGALTTEQAQALTEEERRNSGR
jgi:hypothetical protein